MIEKETYQGRLMVWLPPTRPFQEPRRFRSIPTVESPAPCSDPSTGVVFFWMLSDEA